MDKYIGRKLEGRYEIIELIGFGGMAIVFKAYDIVNQKYVAVKILKDEFLENEDFKRRFRNESKAIAVLAHTNVVKVFDVSFETTIQYIVMEYIDGITLKEYIEQQQIIKWKEAVHFSAQILRALQHAHDNGIVHRDVKPQNIMLLQDGTIKVMDFGIARFARENGKTLSDKAIGSVHYISPEQASGEATDEKTDIYAVGVILYEMLTGAVPFDGETPVSIAIKQMKIEPERPTTINKNIPIGLEEIILRAMQKDPGLRYQSASEMLRDIEEFKTNPNIVFEYKYYEKDGSTKYIDTQAVKAQVTERKPRRRRSYVLNILVGVTTACVLLAVVALYVFFKSVSERTDEMVLGSFIGKTVEEAQAMSDTLKFKIVSEEVSQDYEAGIIIEQKPQEGVTVKISSDIDIVVSSGIAMIKMPELQNETTDSAKSKLNNLGIYDITIAQKTDDNTPEGRVISTDPNVNGEMKKGDRVILYISAGKANEPVEMPSILGLTEIVARTELNKADLSVGSIAFSNSDMTQGVIIEQSIEPGERVTKGMTVDIVLSNGIPPVRNTDITITFPENVQNKEFSFVSSLNGEYIDARYLNPTVDTAIEYKLSQSNGLINGVIPALNENFLEIVVDGQVFAQYILNFNNDSLYVLQEPTFSIMADPYYGFYMDDGYIDLNNPFGNNTNSNVDTNLDDNVDNNLGIYNDNPSSTEYNPMFGD